MERLEFNEKDYNALEGAIHVNRYFSVKHLCKGKKVLDLACGEGYGSYLLSKWGAKNVVGVDISKESIKNANKNFKKENIEFIVSNVEKLTLIKENDFDLIVSFETIEHLKNPELFLKEIKRVLKPNGSIVISCPNDYFYYPTEEEKNEFHLKKYTFEDFEKLTEKHLGKASDYMMGTYVGGYINTLTSKKSNKYKQIEMLKAKSIDTFLITADTKILKDESCYYLGFWNCEKKETSTIFPYQNNIILKELRKFIDLYYETNKKLIKKENIEKELLNNISNINKVNAELNKQLEQSKYLIELINEEKIILIDNIFELQKYSTDLEQQNFVLDSSLNSKIVDLDSVLNSKIIELDSILYSRTYKFSKIISKIVRKLKFW